MSKENTQNSADIPARARRRAFTLQTIRAIADLVARQLTESEACRRLDLEPRQWFNFKSKGKNNAKFCDALEAFQAERNERLLQGIDDAGEGKGLKQPDWRARAWLLATSHPKRFSDAAQRVQIDVSATAAPPDPKLFAEALRIALAAPRKHQPVIDLPAEPPKQLPQKTGESGNHEA